MPNQDVPFEIVDVEPETNKRLLGDFHGERRGFVQAGPKKYFFPSRYREEAADFYYFKLRPDDLWVNTYPRSGTTLMQELIYLVATDDYETAAKVPLVQRFPFIEAKIQSDATMLEEVLREVRGDAAKESVVRRYGESNVPALESATGRRFIKTHIPFSLLPPALLDTCKTVYVARNPKDMVVSYFHHNRLLKALGYVGDFPTYYDYFENDLLTWSPYWEHIREAWALREHPNLLFLFYEDIVKDMPRAIRRVAEFLGKAMTDAQVARLASHLHIDNFRNNPSTNLNAKAMPGLINDGEQNFIRKGAVGTAGSWKKDGFTPELLARVDEWTKTNMASIPGFKFPQH